MIRNSMISKLLFHGQSTMARRAPFGRRLARGFAGSEEGDGPANDAPVIEDELEGAARPARSKNAEYQFYTKNIAIVVDNPLFPFNNRVVHLGKYHSKVQSRSN